MAAILTLLAPVLIGCGSATSQPPRANGRHATVAIMSYSFRPAQITLASGSQITFVNHDNTAHTATETGQTPAFDTGTLKPDQSKTVTLSKPGTYTYYCQFHAFMRATVVVR